MRELSLLIMNSFLQCMSFFKKRDMFLELTVSYWDITFSTETLAVTYSKRFCFLGKEIKSIRNVRAFNIIAKFKALALSFAFNHITFSQVHCSIACKSLRGAQALQCAADLSDWALVHTHP